MDRKNAGNMRATIEQLQARLGLRRSNAARPHKNKKKFHKADRKRWRKEV
jgi:hypothetical protein